MQLDRHQAPASNAPIWSPAAAPSSSMVATSEKMRADSLTTGIRLTILATNRLPVSRVILLTRSVLSSFQCAALSSTESSSGMRSINTEKRRLSAPCWSATLILDSMNIDLMLNIIASPLTDPLTVMPSDSEEEIRANDKTPWTLLASPLLLDSASSWITGIALLLSVCRMPASVDS